MKSNMRQTGIRNYLDEADSNLREQSATEILETGDYGTQMSMCDKSSIV